MRALTDLLFRHSEPHLRRLPARREKAAHRRRNCSRPAVARSLAFLRRKGNSRHPARIRMEKTLDDSALAPFLGAATRRRDASRPGLSPGSFARPHRRRARICSKKAGETWRKALFQAAAGITGLRRALAEAIDAEAGELFRPNAAKPRVNRALADYNKAPPRTSRDAALQARRRLERRRGNARPARRRRSRSCAPSWTPNASAIGASKRGSTPRIRTPIGGLLSFRSDSPSAM